MGHPSPVAHVDKKLATNSAARALADFLCQVDKRGGEKEGERCDIRPNPRADFPLPHIV